MSDIYYTKEHEWLEIEGDKVKVGVTNFAQEQLGDVVYVELPVPGVELDAGSEAAIIESVKAAGEVNAPISGTVLETNSALADDPELVNREAEAAGWLFILTASDIDTADFMDREAYESFLA